MAELHHFRCLNHSLKTCFFRGVCPMDNPMLRKSSNGNRRRYLRFAWRATQRPHGKSSRDISGGLFYFSKILKFQSCFKCLTISGENRLIHSTKMCFLFSGLEFIKGNHGQGINKNVNVLPTWELRHNPIGKLVRNG